MYTKEERIEIGKKVYTREMSYQEAMDTYQISRPTVVNWINLYKSSINAPKGRRDFSYNFSSSSDYSQLSKDELIQELMLKEIELERAKKGYAVKGVGSKKEFVILKDLNTK